MLGEVFFFNRKLAAFVVRTLGTERSSAVLQSLANKRNCVFAETIHTSVNTYPFVPSFPFALHWQEEAI